MGFAGAQPILPAERPRNPHPEFVGWVEPALGAKPILTEKRWVSLRWRSTHPTGETHHYRKAMGFAGAQPILRAKPIITGKRWVSLALNPSYGRNPSLPESDGFRWRSTHPTGLGRNPSLPESDGFRWRSTHPTGL